MLIKDALEPVLLQIQKELNFGNMNVYCSTNNEFVSVLAQYNKNAFDKKYPFFFINSTTVEYLEDGIVNIGEMVIATLSDPNWTSGVRHENSFKPILLPIFDLFTKKLKSGVPTCHFIKQGKMKIHYFYGTKGIDGYDKNEFLDYVDAIQLLNYQVRTNKTC